MNNTGSRLGLCFSDSSFDALNIQARHHKMPIKEFVIYIVECFLAASTNETNRLRDLEKADHYRRTRWAF